MRLSIDVVFTIFRRDFMANISNNNSKNEFIVHNAGYGVKISVIITNGELSHVAHWGTRPESTHDLEKHPNWEHAESMLESIYEYNGREFLSIVKLLNKDSKGYSVIKKIAQKRLAEIMDEAKFWKAF